MKYSPRLLTSAAALALAIAASGAAAATFSFQDHPGEFLDVLEDGRPIARYMYGYDMSTPARREETYKPYLHVFDPQGKELITKGQGGLFTHHRGIFIGWNKLTVAGTVYDRWHMKGGEQVHRRFLDQKAGADGASFTSLVEWTGKGKEPILTEERAVRLLPAAAPAYAVIDVSSKLKAVAGETVLDGDPEHSGLQFRPANEVDGTKTVYLLPRENADPHKDLDYPWVAETVTIRGKEFTVVYLNHPGNPKGARISAYRDYGRFGLFFKDTIPAGGERTIQARFVIAQGGMFSPEAIQKLWNEYAGASEAVPKTRLRPAEQPKPAAAKPAADAAAGAAAGEKK